MPDLEVELIRAQKLACLLMLSVERKAESIQRIVDGKTLDIYKTDHREHFSRALELVEHVVCNLYLNKGALKTRTGEICN